MTPYVTRLLNAIRNTPLNQYDVDNFNELVAYIEELERKAQLLGVWQRFECLSHERIMYDVDGNPSAVV